MRRWPALALLALAACGPGDDDRVPVAPRAPAPTVTAPATTTPATTTPVTEAPPTTGAPPATTTPPAAVAAPATTTVPPPVVVIAYRLERRSTDAATAGFEGVAETTLQDPRGWGRAGVRFERRDDAPYLVVLAEPDEVDRLCLPYDTYGKYSCQNGPTVALNADRWRTATDKWTGDLDTYRQMLVNHEVGHLLGMRHPRPQCPARGRPAPIMNQQSTELNGCLPNPWPLDSEIADAARHDKKLAPGPGE